ncbi:amino acid permease [Flavihumibacter profundi]|uniref:amino acid permease n=1 Tax=Flavihumibacter profundi TaxID=2716883 RepID=UPI001CC3978B|nr:amino acid permease [Flavihumibacter profundi]MBZ5856966.1 amino acid permease [Flavihumibacter profundi]
MPQNQETINNTEDDNDSKEETLLASLGYKQELNRSWSGFSNFAISFSVISILSGCFTTFSQAWNNGGPIAISIGWPIISIFILIIGFCMAELASAYPTSGGIYWWASKLGGPKAGFFAGWLNLIGLLAVNASVIYGAATFLNIILGTYSRGYATNFLSGDIINQQFFLFVAIMVVITILNSFSSHVQAVLNNISVWWHVFGAAVIIAILLFTPTQHQSLKWIYTTQINNSGFAGGATYWLFVLPLGFLLTQYTITGFDASAHLSEETHGAHLTAANGIWKSIFYSAIGGYILLLAFLFAATNPEQVSSFDTAVNPYGAGSVIAILYSSLSPGMFMLVMVISTVGQLFCAVACLTSCSRMLFAFSRDGAVPGHKKWAKVNKDHVPVNAVLMSALIGVLITLPALWKSPRGIPSAFYAVVSIGVIGLYLAFLIPIWLRWREGNKFTPGEWNLGNKYKWMNLVAILEIVIVCFYFIMPFEPAAIPGNKEFTWIAVNYAPILMGINLIFLWLYWTLSAKKWFTGPKRTI